MSAFNVDVIIVGGGVAGCSTAWHLTKAGVNVVLLECGSPGDGNLGAVKIPDDTYTRAGDRLEPNDAFQFAERSGTAVLPTVETIKMIVNLYASSSEDFIRHHGVEGARRYLKLAGEGLRIEKSLAQQALTNPEKDIRSKGSLYVAYESDRAEFEKEFKLLQELGVRDIEWWEKERVQAASGGVYADFSLGIHFPHDAVINSAQFCKDLLALAQRSHPGSLTVRQGCSEVTSVDQESAGVRVTLASGEVLTCQQAVVATGGLFLPPTLAGILKPCWSYLVGIATPQTASPATAAANPFVGSGLAHPHSMNLFTWGFTHDWCSTDGYMRVSGEDHFSALKPPRMEERCRNLAQWTYEKYPYLLPNAADAEAADVAIHAEAAAKDALHYHSQYGVYSETPDAAPLVGSLTSQDRIFYCVGCNAWGQAVLSYSASLLPGLMGRTELSEEQRDLAQLVTIRRFCLLPGNRK